MSVPNLPTKCRSRFSVWLLVVREARQPAAPWGSGWAGLGYVSRTRRTDRGTLRAPTPGPGLRRSAARGGAMAGPREDKAARPRGRPMAARCSQQPRLARQRDEPRPGGVWPRQRHPSRRGPMGSFSALLSVLTVDKPLKKFKCKTSSLKKTKLLFNNFGYNRDQ